MGNLMRILRSSLCDGHMNLTSISDVLCDYLIHITDVNIKELQWSELSDTKLIIAIITLATPSVEAGGLGLCNLMQLVLPTFLAPAFSTLQLQNDLLRNCLMIGLIVTSLDQGHLYVPVRPRPANKLCPLNFSISTCINFHLKKKKFTTCQHHKR